MHNLRRQGRVAAGDDVVSLPPARLPVGEQEIDFVAIKRNEKLYIQVASSIDDPETFQREVDPLLKIKDAYPKLLLARTRQEMYQHEGIQIFDVADWLLKEKD